MGSQIWGYWAFCITYLVYAIFFFPPQKNSWFSSEKCLGIIASELQFYYMKNLMFCLKQYSLKEPIC